jgi:hypothetical protein
MIPDFGIPIGTRVEIDGDGYRYKYRLDFGHVLTDEATGLEREPISHEEMNGFYRAGRIRMRGIGRPNRYTGFPVALPDEGLTQAEKLRAFYVRAWDEEPSSISHVAMKPFIERVHGRAARKGLVGPPPSTGAVMAWIRLRGERDFRPDNVMRTRTGKVKRTGKSSAAVEKLIFEAVCWFCAAAPRQKDAAWHRVVRFVGILNGIRRRRNPEATLFDPPCQETVRLRVEIAWG